MQVQVSVGNDTERTPPQLEARGTKSVHDSDDRFLAGKFLS